MRFGHIYQNLAQWENVKKTNKNPVQVFPIEQNVVNGISPFKNNTKQYEFIVLGLFQR